MSASSSSHIQPEKNRNPAEAESDPRQLKAEGEQGISNNSLGKGLTEQNNLTAAVKKTCRMAVTAGSILFAATSSAQSTVSCTTQGQTRQFCRAETQNGVLLQHDHSHGACHYGSTWGFNPRGIYVSGGCSADFLVNGPSSRDQHGYGNQLDQGGPGRDDHNNFGSSPDGNNGNNGSGQYGSRDQDHQDRHLTLPPGTQIQVRLDHDVSPQDVKQGDAIPATLTQGLVANGTQIAPAGTRVRLRVTEDDPNRHDPLSVQLDSLRTDQAHYSFTSNAIHSDRDSQNAQSSNNDGNPLGAALNALESRGRSGGLSAGSVFTFRLLSPAHPESLNAHDR